MNSVMRLLVWGICLAAAVPAIAAGPSIESISPGIGQRGTVFQLKIVGAKLASAPELVFYQPGLSCTGIKVADENELAVELKSEANCQLGSHPFRLRTNQGFSELKLIRVTPLPVVAAVEPNETPMQAMAISSNVTVSGTLPSGDVDCFTVSLKKGERLSAEVEAVRLGAQLVDTVLTVYGPDGKVIAKVDDTALFGQDPYLTIVAQMDGQYVIHVQEAALEGDESSRYALHVGNFPRPDFAFPPGGMAGQTVAVEFIGDALGTAQQQIRLPDQAGAEYGVFAEQMGLSSPTAIRFRISPFQNLIEVDPNDELTTLTHPPVELPIAFNGVLEKISDVDRYRFLATEGVMYQFEVFAHQLGSPVDTVISIVDTSDTLLVRNDDSGSHDSRLVFRVPRSGEFQLIVTDKRGEGGKSFFYRVEATELRPAIKAFLPRPNRASQERQTISIPQGNRVLGFLAVSRHGIEGPVLLQPQDLPAGVQATSMMVAADQFLAPFVFEANTDAPLGGALVPVTAKLNRDGLSISGQFEQVIDLIHGSADTLYQSATVDRLAVAVVEPAEFRLQLEEPKPGLAKDGTIGLVVNVERTMDFDGPVDITFPFLPPGVDGPAKLTIPAGATQGTYEAHAFPTVQVREWSICAEGKTGLGNTRGAGAAVAASPNATGGGAMNRAGGGRSRRRGANSDVVVSSQLVQLKLSQSPVSGKMGSIATEQGAILKVVCSIERNADLAIPETLVATLEGLPNRVVAQAMTISATDRQVEFTIQLDKTAPVGTYDSIVCRLSGKIDGHEVSYCIGRGSKLQIQPAGALIRDEKGRPLSPLEVLRKSKVTPVVPSATR